MAQFYVHILADTCTLTEITLKPIAFLIRRQGVAENIINQNINI